MQSRRFFPAISMSTCAWRFSRLTQRVILVWGKQDTPSFKGQRVAGTESEG